MLITVFAPHEIYTFINSKHEIYAPIKLHTILQRKGLAWRAMAHNRSGSVSFQQIIFGQLTVFIKHKFAILKMCPAGTFLPFSMHFY